MFVSNKVTINHSVEEVVNQTSPQQENRGWQSGKSNQRSRNRSTGRKESPNGATRHSAAHEKNDNRPS